MHAMDLCLQFNKSACLNPTLIVVCLTDDLEHLIYWSDFTLPAISPL